MRRHKSLFAYGIFKVIYSPLKAFKELVQKPTYRGGFLILILFTAVYAGSTYVVLSKTYDERTLPGLAEGDRWTENRTGWTSNANITENSDGVGGSYFGNKTVGFSASNSTQLWLQLSFGEHVDCSAPDGFKNMSIRIKILSPVIAEVRNVSLHLLSNSTDYFSYDLTGRVTSIDNDLWNNITTPVGSENGWESMGTGADWANLTGLRLEFSGSRNTNWTVRIDGLFFRGIYRPVMDSVGTYILAFSVNAVTLFVVRWMFLGGFIYAVTKVLKGKATWQVLLALAGFVLVTSFVQSVINIGVYSAMPKLYYPLEASGGVEAESSAALSRIGEETALVSQIGMYVLAAMHIWAGALCVIVIRLSSEFTWAKSAIAATLAYVVSLLLTNLLTGY
jgi:hypothetical protein